MKRQIALFASVLVFGAAVAASAQTATKPAVSAEPFGTSVAALYTSIRGFIIGAAEKMPEAEYAFKPTPEVRSFGQLVGHVANAQYNFCGSARQEKRPAGIGDLEKLQTKAELVKALKDSFAFCDAAYQTLDNDKLNASATFGPKTVAAGYPLMFNIAHDNEHYGNMVTYLRMKNITPPSSEPRR